MKTILFSGTALTLAAGLLMLLSAGRPAQAATAINLATPQPQWHVQTETYSVLLSEHGIVDSFKNPGGVELLRSDKAGVRAVVLMGPEGIVSLPNVKAMGERTLQMWGPRATLCYDFTPQGLECTVNNRSSDTLTLVFNFSTQFKRICNDQGQWHPCPVNGVSWGGARFFSADGSGLDVSGSVGYWTGLVGEQFGQVAIAPGTLYHVRLTAIQASQSEMETISQALHPWREESGLILHSPRNWQVFQRQTRLEGQMLLSGRAVQECDRIEYRLTGSSLTGKLSERWHKLPFNPVDRSFSEWITVPAGGWYQLEVKGELDGQTIFSRTVEKTGVGEVFIGAGQSNSTNWGQFPITQTSGMVSATDGVQWQLANDPQPGTHDRSSWGSFWPAFGDAMFEKYHVPIGVAVAGHGGTNVSLWQPGGELHSWMMGRIHQMGRGGFRALLWHQGEAEVYEKNKPEIYYEKQKDIILAAQYEAGWAFPWLLAQVTYLSPDAATNEPIRAIQRRLWDEKIALPGPDTDTLTGDCRDFDGLGVHLSPKGLKAHGLMWAGKVADYLDPILAEQ